MTKKILKESWNILLKRESFIPIALDLIFLFLYGFIYSGLMSKFAEYLYLIQSQAIVRSLIPQTFYKSLIILIIFIIFISITYVYVEGVAWWLLFPKKISLKKFLKKFALKSINILLIYIFFSSLQLIQGFLRFSELNIPVLFHILKIIIACLAFMVLVSYSRIFKNFRINKTHITPFIIFIIIISLNLFTTPVLAIPIGLFIIMPGFTYLRIVLYKLRN